jgi:flagellar biosynthesis/type III secretory pathway protein FliH
MGAIADMESKIASALEEGEAKGMEKGEKKKQREMVMQAHKAGMLSTAIAEMFDLEVDEVEQMLKETG